MTSISKMQEQFEVFSYENTMINDNYFQKKNATQFYSTNNNDTQLSEDLDKKEKPSARFRFDSCDITSKSLVNNINKCDYLSIASSLSSKKEEISPNKLQRHDEGELCKKIIESDTSSEGSLDSFELEFEDNELKMNESFAQKASNSSKIGTEFNLEDFMYLMKSLKKNVCKVQVDYHRFMKKYQ